MNVFEENDEQLEDPDALKTLSGNNFAYSTFNSANEESSFDINNVDKNTSLELEQNVLT